MKTREEVCFGCDVYINKECLNNIKDYENCPCSECIIKPICKISCEAYINYMKNNNYY